MAVLIDNWQSHGKTGSGTPFTTDSWSYTLSALPNRILVLIALFKRTTDPGGDAFSGGFTVNGVAMTRTAYNATAFGARIDIVIYHILEASIPASGAVTIAYTLGLTCDQEVNVGVMTLYNCSQIVTIPDAVITSTNSGSSTSISDNITTTRDKAMVIEGVGLGANATVSAANSQTSLGALSANGHAHLANFSKEIATLGVSTPLGVTYGATTGALHALAAFAPIPTINAAIL